MSSDGSNEAPHALAERLGTPVSESCSSPLTNSGRNQVKPLLFFITLENFQTITGQQSRLLKLLPQLARWARIVFVGRKGCSPRSLEPFFWDRMELPVPLSVRPSRYFLHPAGPFRLGRLAWALDRIPVSNGVVYADSILLAHMVSRTPCRKLICEVNGIICEEFRVSTPLWGPLLSPVIRRWERWGFHQADRLVVVGPGLASYLKSSAGVTETRIVRLGNGVDPHRFSPDRDGGSIRRRLGWERHPVGVFVSTFKPWHGATNLLAAMTRVLGFRPDFRLLLVGDGPCRQEARVLAKGLGIGHAVHFTGAVTPEEVPDYIAASDLGLYYPARPSHRFGFLFDPIKFYEYMAMGKPVITVRMPNLGDVVVSTGAGMLTEATPDAFARGIAEMIDQPHRRREMGRKGRRAVLDAFSWSTIARRIADLCFDDATRNMNG